MRCGRRAGRGRNRPASAAAHSRRSAGPVKNSPRRPEVPVENPAASGVDSLKTEGGTISYGLKAQANVADWPAFYAFIAANNRFDMLHKRVSDKVIEDYAIEAGLQVAEDPARPAKIPPPGVILNTKRTISIRRPGGK